MGKNILKITALLFICFFSSYTEECFSSLLVKPAERVVTMTSFTRSGKEIIISSEVSGRAVEVNYELGDIITEKPFIHIDPSQIKFSLDKKKLEKKLINNNIARVKCSLKFQEDEFERIKLLRKENGTTEIKYNEAENKVAQTRLNLKELKIKRDANALDISELTENLSKYTIRGMKGCVVTEKNIDTGELVRPGIKLAVVSNFNSIVIPFSVSNEELKAFKKLPEEFPGEVEGVQVKTKIDYINPKFNVQTRKLDILLKIVGTPPVKRGGVRYTTKLSIKTEGLIVPKAAVMNRYGNPKVKLKYSGKEVPVMVLGETGDNLIISSNKDLIVGAELERMNTNNFHM